MLRYRTVPLNMRFIGYGLIENKPSGISEGTHTDMVHHAPTAQCAVHAAMRGYSFVAWLRLEGVKLQGASAGRALFTLAGRTPEGPKGIAAAFKGACLTVPCWVLTPCVATLRLLRSCSDLGADSAALGRADIGGPSLHEAGTIWNH